MVMMMVMLTIIMELMVLLWQGYFAGGAGYVLSRAAVKRLVEVEEYYKKLNYVTIYRELLRLILPPTPNSFGVSHKAPKSFFFGSLMCRRLK